MCIFFNQTQTDQLVACDKMQKNGPPNGGFLLCYNVTKKNLNTIITKAEALLLKCKIRGVIKTKGLKVIGSCIT